MARLLRSEIYAEINAYLCGLKHLDKENKYKIQLDELEIQNKRILLNSLIGDSYFKLIYRANIIEKLSCSTIILVRLESFLQLIYAAKIVLLLTFVLKTTC